MHNVIERCISAGRHYTGLWVSYFFVDRAPCEGLHTIYESQRSIQGIFSGGKIKRLPDRIYSVNLCMMEPEQRVAWRGEEIIVDT